jgi:hypothetical protein
MALSFGEVIDIPPVPVDARRAARQALALSRSIASTGSLAAAKAAAVQVILDASPNDPPSELRRLRLLYQDAYTVPELERLVDRTFTELDLTDRP